MTEYRIREIARDVSLERPDEALARSAAGVSEPVLARLDIEPAILMYKRWGGRWVLVDSVATSEREAA